MSRKPDRSNGTFTALCILLLVLAGCASRAQSTQTREAAAVCTNMPVAPAATQNVTRTLYALAELGYEAPDTARAWAINLLSEFEKGFRFPSPATFGAWAMLDSLGDSVAVPVIAMETMLVIGPDGELRQLALSQTSLVPAIDSAVQTALRVAVQGGGVRPPSVHGISKDVTLYFALTLDPTAGHILSNKLDSQAVVPIRRTVELPLFNLELPSARLSALLGYDRKRSQMPHYPEQLRQASRDGKVTVEFVVGRAGRVAPGTVRFIGGTERRFAAAVLESLAETRFFPPEIGGCPIAILTIQGFEFRVD